MNEGKDVLRDIFLVSVGSMAYAAEWGRDAFESLVAKGESVVGRGPSLDGELHRNPPEPPKSPGCAAPESE